MTTSSDTTPPARRERLIRRGTFDLGVAGRIVKSHVVTILVAIGVCIALAILFLHIAPRTYAVRLYITAAAPTEKSAGALSALSSIAGLGLGPAENPKFREFLAALLSPVAAEAIIDNQAMVRVIFPREWSVKYGRWSEPHSSLRAPANFVKRILGIPVVPWSPPNAARVYEFLRDNLSVNPDVKSGITMVELDSDRPQDAKQLLVTLNQSIDNWMRQHDLQLANDDIAYLSRELSQATVEDLRSAIAGNLSEQEHARMLASAPLPYVSDMLGTPLVSPRPAHPRPIPVLLGAVVIGFLIGFGRAARKYGRR